MGRDNRRFWSVIVAIAVVLSALITLSIQAAATHAPLIEAGYTYNFFDSTTGFRSTPNPPFTDSDYDLGSNKARTLIICVAVCFETEMVAWVGKTVEFADAGKYKFEWWGHYHGVAAACVVSSSEIFFRVRIFDLSSNFAIYEHQLAYVNAAFCYSTGVNSDFYHSAEVTIPSYRVGHDISIQVLVRSLAVSYVGSVINDAFNVVENRGIWYDQLRISWVPTGGGGSPFVAPWDGIGYEPDNNILPLSEVFDRDERDVIDYYRLEKPLVQRSGRYALRLTEFEEEHSFIDSVELLAVDRDEDSKIGVHQQTGSILTYEDGESPEAATDGYNRDILSALVAWDGAVYEGWRGDYVELDFGEVNKEDARLIVVADTPVLKTRIYVQVWNGTDWEVVDTMHHRMYFAEYVVDLTGHVPTQSLLVKLLGVSHFKLESVALDTSPAKSVQFSEPVLIDAVHSSGSDVFGALTSRNGAYAEMSPGESIYLNFTVPEVPDPDWERSFILASYGHYTHKYQPLQGTDMAVSGLDVSLDAVIPQAPLGEYWEAEIETLEWEMGDGANYAGSQVAHSYADPGEYDVTIRITYTDGHVKGYERRIVLS